MRCRNKEVDNHKDKQKAKKTNIHFYCVYQQMFSTKNILKPMKNPLFFTKNLLKTIEKALFSTEDLLKQIKNNCFTLKAPPRGKFSLLDSLPQREILSPREGFFPLERDSLPQREILCPRET